MEEYRKITSYNYCSDTIKDDIFRRHEATKKEKEKERELVKRINDYVIRVHGIKALYDFYKRDQKIQYIIPWGYVLIGNYDRDEVVVYSLGKTIKKAFMLALFNFESHVSIEYELRHRDELNKQFSDRFLDGVYSHNDYHGPFFFSEHALQDFRKYYGNDIPKEIISHYENKLENKYKYDYETNRFVLNSDNNKNNK